MRLAWLKPRRTLPSSRPRCSSRTMSSTLLYRPVETLEEVNPITCSDMHFEVVDVPIEHVRHTGRIRAFEALARLLHDISPAAHVRGGTHSSFRALPVLSTCTVRMSMFTSTTNASGLACASKGALGWARWSARSRP